MKKNTMMRLASILLVAVLISTSAISGTYAKYVTADEGSDSARVAKWGVIIDIEGSLFEPAYKDAPAEYTANEKVDSITVQAKDQADVVAPGTKSNNGMIITLTGTPEVDTEIVFSITANKDVVLPAGTYRDYTSADESATFVLSEEYRPIKFTLTNAAGQKVVDKGSLSDVEAYLESFNNIYHTNTDLANELAGGEAGTFQLTWEWAFDENYNPNNLPTNDKADTYLGNLAAGIIDNAPEGASTEIEIVFEITATQID